MSPSTIRTAPGVRCGNRAYHGTDVVYHADSASVRECYANSGQFSTRNLVSDAEMARAAEQVRLADARRQQEAREAAEQAARNARYAAWRSIPVFGHSRSYHALEINGSTRFFRIERPSTGKWAGRTFVTEQAGDNFHKMPFGASAQIMDLIAADSMASRVLYGQQIGRCGDCHRSLTDAVSRARGIGPDCIKNH